MFAEAREAVVTRVDREAQGILALTLEDVGGHVLPDWRPGAHIDLLLASGLTRQYSLCGDPADLLQYRIAVLKEARSRGGSRHIHERVGVGDRIPIRAPRNHFELVPADDYQFIAGGIGITPLLPMIAAVAETHPDRWQLLYGGKSRSSMAFLGDLARYDDDVRLFPSDETGRMDLDRALGELRPGTAVYCCGPVDLVEAVREGCRRRGSDLRFHFELFQAGEKVPAPGPADAAFEVECRRSGVTVPVRPGESILACVERAGVHVPNDCKDGVCGRCETKILSGEADHRDKVLDDSERDEQSCMMVCVSRSRGRRLVLDL